MKEALVKERIKKALAAQQVLHKDVYWFMPPANGYGRSGIPDFVACVNGVFCAIEAKGEGGEATALQLRELEFVITAGGIALVITHKHEIEAVVASMCTMARQRLKGPTQ